MQASMRAVFADLGCSACTAKAMVEDQGIETLDDLCFLKDGMLRHCTRMSYALEVQLVETTGNQLGASGKPKD